MFSANSSQVSDDKLFVEDVFSTYLYRGNGTTQTITNGIDLAGKDGMVWIKNRNASSDPLHYLNFKDGSNISSNNSNNTSAKQVMTPYAAFNSDGFFVNALPGFLNNSGVDYASWTFREAPKFFDVVTYTGNGTSGGSTRTLSHNLGVAPGMVIIKCTTTGYAWVAWHRSAAGNGYLNTTAAFADDGYGITVTATTVSFVAGNGATNANGDQYVMYLYAHDATSDGIIQCGSYTGAYPASQTVTLGWEPQWVMIKGVTGGDAYSNWGIWDNMRGMPVGGNDPLLDANRTTEEGTTYTNTGDYLSPTATGFIVDPAANGWNINNTTGYTYIYIAIRRGPMKTPTLGTSVFAPITSSGTAGTQLTTSFPVDLAITARRSTSDTYNSNFTDRLRRMQPTDEFTDQKILVSSSTAAESVGSSAVAYQFWNTGFRIGNYNSGVSTVYWNFRRAPGFFDEVCYTGTGVARTVNHNLGVVPTLTIIKRRDTTSDWRVTTNFENRAFLNDAALFTTDPEFWGYGTPTSATIPLGINASINASGGTYVAYLFASAPGVSKVGSYTGNGSSQTINCGFAAGARFVMIKRTDSTGDWYVWDTARGIVAGNDPHLSLNTTAAEVTTDDTIDTDSSGFVVNQDAATNVNVNAATYIYLAIA